MAKEKCGICGERTYNMVHLTNKIGEIEVLCNNCHNEKLAEIYDIPNYNDFQRVYKAIDYNNKPRTFYIQKNLFPIGVMWTALETNDDKVLEEGYQFNVHASLDEDPQISVQRLFNQVNKGLSMEYIKQKYFEGHVADTLPYDKFVGRIEWDEIFDGEIPKIIVDGKAYTWGQIGKILMAYEGWDLKLELFDKGEE